MDHDIIYELEVSDNLTQKQRMADTPNAYRVLSADTESGIMVWGKYGEVWTANPNCRELIAHLLRVIS